MQKCMREHSGFTLIELLLVIILIAIALGISMPFLARSAHGNRLRVAARTMVTVARYARSMAVLKQTDLSINFNLDTGEIDLVSSNVTLPQFSRMVEGVRLSYIEIFGATSPYTEGTCSVPYNRNGNCKPFNIKITDKHGNYVTVKVDALSSIKGINYGKD